MSRFVRLTLPFHSPRTCSSSRFGINSNKPVILCNMATTEGSILEESVVSSSDYSLLGAFSHPLPIEIVISTVVWLMCIFAVFGNILIFVVILRDKQLRSNVANMYILNLASADLCVGLNSLIMNNIWRHAGNWPFRRALCTFWSIVDYSACMQAAFAVILISLDRYLLVTKYLQYRKYQSRAVAGGLIASTWTVSLMFYSVPILGNEFLPNTKAYGVVDYSVTCDFGVLYILSYNIAQLIIGFTLPAGILLYLNVKVYSNILQRAKGLVRAAVLPAQASAATECGNDPALQRGPSGPPVDSQGVVRSETWNTKRTYKKHRKAAITLALIVGVFSICWIPYYVVQLLFVVGKIKFSWLLWNGVYYTVWANSAINPFIYAATSPRIRRGIIQCLCIWNRSVLRRIHPM